MLGAGRGISFKVICSILITDIDVVTGSSDSDLLM